MFLLHFILLSTVIFPNAWAQSCHCPGFQWLPLPLQVKPQQHGLFTTLNSLGPVLLHPQDSSLLVSDLATLSFFQFLTLLFPAFSTNSSIFRYVFPGLPFPHIYPSLSFGYQLSHFFLQEVFPRASLVSVKNLKRSSCPQRQWPLFIVVINLHLWSSPLVGRSYEGRNWHQSCVLLPSNSALCAIGN